MAETAPTTPGAHTGASFYPLHRPGQSVPVSPSFPAIEKDVLAYWKADGTFAASIANRAQPCDEFVFYDGPPFANGLPDGSARSGGRPERARTQARNTPAAPPLADPGVVST